jgi:hypothetical protein
VTLRARRVTLRARWVMLRASWVTLRARWVTLRTRWVTPESQESPKENPIGSIAVTHQDRRRPVRGRVSHVTHAHRRGHLRRRRRRRRRDRGGAHGAAAAEHVRARHGGGASHVQQDPRAAAAGDAGETRREREKESGPGGLTREVERPLPSNHPRCDQWCHSQCYSRLGVLTRLPKAEMRPAIP